MNGTGLGSWSFFIVLAAAIAVVGMMMLPFFSMLAFGAVLAFLFAPLNGLFVRIVRNRSLAAFVVTLLMLAVVLVPLAVAGYQAVREGASVYNALRSGSPPAFVVTAASYVRLNPDSLVGMAQTALSWTLAQTGRLFLSVGAFVVSFILFLFVFFYLLRDGRRLSDGFIRLSPLSAREGSAVLAKIGTSVRAAVIGSVLMGLVQGLTAWLGFWLLNVPNAALLGGLTMLASFIPSVGTGLVQVPVIAYLFFTGAHGAALVLAVWSVVVVGLLDNFLRAKFLAGTHMHPLVALLSVVGGVTLFGPVGIVLGPAMVAVSTALLEVSPAVVRRASRPAGGGR